MVHTNAFTLHCFNVLSTIVSINQGEVNVIPLIHLLKFNLLTISDLLNVLYDKNINYNILIYSYRLIYYTHKDILH